MRRTTPPLLGLIAALGFGIQLAAQSTSVTDQRGKTHSFQVPATHVVTIAIPLFWTFMTVDGTDTHVAGANSVANQQMKDGILSRVFPHADRVPTAITRGGTFTPNIEALLALRPDAVFQWADRGDELVAALDRVGLEALGVKNTNSEGDIEAWIRMSGVVAGKRDRADSIIRFMQRGNQRFDSITARLPAARRPRVLMLTEYSKQIRVDGPRSYSVAIIRRAGGINAALVDGTINAEQILAWNPDVVLLSHFEAKTPTDFVNDPVWSKTNAARTGRVYKLPFGVTRWGGYGPESPLMLSWLTTLLYPGTFLGPVRAEMRAAYQSLYHYALSDADIDRVLQSGENAGMANYNRLAQSLPK